MHTPSRACYNCITSASKGCEGCASSNEFPSRVSESEVASVLSSLGLTYLDGAAKLYRVGKSDGLPHRLSLHGVGRSCYSNTNLFCALESRNIIPSKEGNFGPGSYTGDFSFVHRNGYVSKLPHRHGYDLPDLFAVFVTAANESKKPVRNMFTYDDPLPDDCNGILLQGAGNHSFGSGTGNFIITHHPVPIIYLLVYTKEFAEQNMHLLAGDDE